MKLLRKLVLLSMGLSFLLVACDSEEDKIKELKIKIDKQADVSAIPSTSGIECYKGKIYVVSDDSPWLFELDSNWQLKNKLTLKEYTLDANGRVPKADKPDYEALTIDENKIIVLGSGSKSPQRDFGYIIDIKSNEITEIVLTSFYSELKKLANIPAEKEINIEALVATKKYMFIFHRGNNSENTAFRITKEEFYSYFNNTLTSFPKVDILKFNLPSLSNALGQEYVSGFSGACYFAEKDALLLTSSVETTGDAYNDGQILGSFIAYLPLKEFSDGKDLRKVFTPITRDDKKVITKLESISVQEVVDDSRLKVIAASDNDTGLSEFFALTLEL